MLERWFAFGVLLALLFSLAHWVNEDETAAPPIPAPLDDAEPDDEKVDERREPPKPRAEEKDERKKPKGLVGGLLGGGRSA